MEYVFEQKPKLDDLEHYGTKGMKWGVRRAAKKAAKADKKWQDNIYSVRGAIAVHNAVADRMNNGGISRLNARHPNAHLDHDTPATRAYLRDYENLTMNYTRDAVASVHGISPSGNLRARLETSGPEGARIVVESTEARHADEELPTMIFELNTTNGRITRFSNIKEDVNHSAFDKRFSEYQSTGQKFVESLFNG